MLVLGYLGGGKTDKERNRIMFWPFKKEKVPYPGNAVEAISSLYNQYLLKWFEENPDVKEYMKARIPFFDELNILHNMCAINMMLSFKIDELECKIDELMKHAHQHKGLKNDLQHSS